MDLDFGYREMPQITNQYFKTRDLMPDSLIDVELTLVKLDPAPGPSLFERLFKLDQAEGPTLFERLFKK